MWAHVSKPPCEAVLLPDEKHYTELVSTRDLIYEGVEIFLVWAEYKSSLKLVFELENFFFFLKK